MIGNKTGPKYENEVSKRHKITISLRGYNIAICAFRVVLLYFIRKISA